MLRLHASFQPCLFAAGVVLLASTSLRASDAPQLAVSFEAGQLEVRVTSVPAEAHVELILHSDRNSAVSHSAEISPHDPRGLTTKLRATYWYPVVDVALEPDMAALARFDPTAAGRYTINGMFHPEPQSLAPELRLPAARLQQWENSIAVEPQATLRGFALTAPAPVRDGSAIRAFRLLTPQWRGEVEARILTLRGSEPIVLRTSVDRPSADASGDPLLTWRARGLERERLAVSLQATLGFLLRMQDRTPGSPTQGGLNLFYDHAARTFRRPHWIWSSGPSVKLLLEAANAGPTLIGEIDPHELRRVAREIGETSRRFQLRAPNDPVDGVVTSRWREAEGDLNRNGGFDRFYSVADALFLIGWAWVPLARETGDRSWLEDSQRLVEATERLMGQFDIIPMDFLSPPGEWKNYTIDEAGFAPEGLAALHATTGRERLQWLGATYMNRLSAHFEQPNGLWARRIEFKPRRIQHAPRVTRGAGWAMEGLLATYELTRDRRYLDKAVRFAAHLQKAQQPDGAWAFEFDQPVAKVGVGEKATALWALLFYRLYGHTGDPAHLATARRALGWCLDNQYAGPDADGRGGIIGITFQSGVTYRPWFPLACSYTSAFFGLAVMEELKLQTSGR